MNVAKMIGDVLELVSPIFPKNVEKIRLWMVDRIMSKYCDSYMGKLAVMNKLNVFLSTIKDAEKHAIIEKLQIPKWTNDGVYRGMM